MSMFIEERTIASNQVAHWTVEYRDAEGENPLRIGVEASNREQAINNASAQLNASDMPKPARMLYFHSAQRL